MMDYMGLSTARLTKLLAAAAGGSAEHKAIRKEMHSRELKKKPDMETLLIFGPEEWARLKSTPGIKRGDKLYFAGKRQQWLF
jgi:hypothetical protein